MQPDSPDRNALLTILHDAYSGELAAALAYRGHWKSVSDPSQRQMIQQIEQDEWDHRERVGRMLAALGSGPIRRKELKRWIIGRVIAIGCRMVGWFIPMYFAGRLEGQNICAYDIAAVHAAALGLFDFERDLLDMEQVEQTHEEFFYNLIADHPMFPKMQKWFAWAGKTSDCGLQISDCGLRIEEDGRISK